MSTPSFVSCYQCRFYNSLTIYCGIKPELTPLGLKHYERHILNINGDCPHYKKTWMFWRFK